MKRSVLYTVRVTVFASIFGLGYLCGTVNQRNADAEWGEVGQEMLKRAGESGGPIGNIAKMGSTIAEMEKQVTGLQKNLDTLKGVKAALGGALK